MLKNKNTKKIKYSIGFILTIIVGCFFAQITYAQTSGFYDVEESLDNLIQTPTLDLVVFSDTDDFSDNYDSMFPGDTVERHIFVKNVGSLPFLYKQKYVYDSGEKDLCDVLELKVTYLYYDTGGVLHSVEKYDGLLSDYDINSLGSDPDLKIPNAHDYYPNSDYEEDEHWYLFEIKVPDDAPYDVSEKTCGFDFRTVAWQEEFPDETQGFWDVEYLSNTIGTSDWNPPEVIDITIYDHEDVNLYCDGVTDNENVTIDWNDVDIFDFASYDLEMFEDVHIAYPLVSEYPYVLPDLGTYMFRVRVIDTEQNMSEWSNWCSVTLVRSYEPGDMLFNEIMWGGSSEHELDEWIELYNSTEEDIDLTGWSVKAAGPSFHEIILSGTAPSGGYFMVAHYPVDHDKNNEKAAIWDELELDSGFILVDSDLKLTDNGEELILVDPFGNEIDRTPEVDKGKDKGWEAGEAGIYGHNTPWRSMELNDEGDGWHSSCQNELYWDYYWENEETGGLDYGTPMHENSDGQCTLEEIIIP